jgi:hypothetical protein
MELVVNYTILAATFMVELVMGVLGFISLHLRAAAKRRHLAKLPKWESPPYRFNDLNHFDSNIDKEVLPPKIMKPRSGLK